MRAVSFYEDVLGMRLSDRSGEGIAFMHAIHGSDHHVIAFAKSSAPGYHHSSWDVGSLDEARARGCSRVYWLTHETNAEAMRLYDGIADRPGFVQYRKIF